MSPELLVETHALVKEYGDFVAVDGVDLLLSEGEVYGFLGPNGSGKSTTILMMLGLTEPTEGTVRVCGHDPTRNPIAVKRQVGYLPENLGFYGDLTGRENLRYTAELNNIDRAEANSRITDLLATVELSDAANQPVAQYSRGMRQRLGLADVLLKRPRLVILDDPTLGLDPTGIEWLLGMIEELSSQRNIAVFLSSHQLHEVQRVCHRVGIMSHGRIVLEGTVSELTAQTADAGFSIVLEVRADARSGTGVRDALAAIEGVSRCEQTGSRINIESDRDVRAAAAAVVIGGGGELVELRSQNRTLEDIYLRYFQQD